MKTLIPQEPSCPPQQIDPKELHKQHAIDTLARTMWGEARGQGIIGLQAVANVILNRVNIARKKGGYWWGNDIVQVCRHPYQFSCWNKNDPNYERLQRVSEKDIYFATCLRLARRAVYANLDDPTGGADHYHASYVSPFWAHKQTPIAIIGDHLFYKLVEV